MSRNNRVLVVDDELSVRRLLQEVIRKSGYEAFTAENGLEALEKSREIKPAVIIMDIMMPVMGGMEAFDIIREESPEIAVILMTAYGTVDTVVEAMKRGAFDYLVKPSNIDEVRILLNRAFQMRRLSDQLTVLRSEVQGKYQLNQIIGKSSVMQQVYKVVGRVAQTHATVLITGESGSGKGMIAKIIHNNSPRRDGPFIQVNCGALPEGLMESELFGYEKGAFTGAVARKPGRFELAEQGTLFLDEVSELTLALQVKLLRALQEKEFERVGGIQTLKADVRIIAATNRNLEEMVRQGSFREDLYYRLKVVPIHVPSLRERKDDIALLVDYFVHKIARETHREIPIVMPEAVNLLEKYDWPGNVRELANVLERAIIMCGSIIDAQDLVDLGVTPRTPKPDIPVTGKLKDILRQVEKEVIARELKAQQGNRVRTAQVLDISRRALLYKIEEYGLAESLDIAEDN